MRVRANQFFQIGLGMKLLFPSEVFDAQRSLQGGHLPEVQIWAHVAGGVLRRLIPVSFEAAQVLLEK
jgi:hypothetical protein